jgi:hypothetical protein
MGASIRQAPDYHFQPGLIFVGKARPLLEKAVGIKILIGTNTLAYLLIASVKKKRVFMNLFFSSSLTLDQTKLEHKSSFTGWSNKAKSLPTVTLNCTEPSPSVSILWFNPCVSTGP